MFLGRRLFTLFSQLSHPRGRRTIVVSASCSEKGEISQEWERWGNIVDLGVDHDAAYQDTLSTIGRSFLSSDFSLPAKICEISY